MWSLDLDVGENPPFARLGENRLGVPEQVVVLTQMVAAEEGAGIAAALAAVAAAYSFAGAQPQVGESGPSGYGASAGTELVVGNPPDDPVADEAAAMNVQLDRVGLSASLLAFAVSQAAVYGTTLVRSGLGEDMS